MTLVQNIKTFIKSHSIQGTKATWGLFLLFAGIIFVKVVLFHWFTFHSIPISAIYRDPTYFWPFWLAKGCISIFLAFFIFTTHRKWWTVVLMLVIDLWIISNLVYFRANNCFLTWNAMMMVGNLAGFGSSIGFYWNTQCSLFLIITAIYSLFVLFLQPQPNKIGRIIVAFVFLIAYVISSSVGMTWSWKNYIPFRIQQSALPKIKDVNGWCISHHSIISYFPMTIIYSTLIDFNELSELIKLNDEDVKQLFPFINQTSDKIIPDYNLIVVLVESLESFALEMKDIHGNYVLPNIKAFSESEHVVYANKITSQVKYGTSIDGQMIVSTGLLPIQNGAAAIMYGKNTYPNYAHLFDIAVLSNPSLATTWNQNIVTYSFGYKEHYNVSGGMNDSQTFARLSTCLPTYTDSSFCYLAITVDSHSPFNRVPANPNLHLDIEMPEEMRNYLNCLHFTDSCFGVWYNEWKDTEQAANTIVVLTSDHDIFKEAYLPYLISYAKQAGVSIASGKTYCPLIIQAPQIEENMQITDICYQMDVYPTILHLIGCEDYYWKGFGVNLFDSTARHNRPITEEQAYQLSDKLIRADYFRELQ